jgi:DNA-binding CsgD family transcriptional regulator/dipeptidyl aminopeptidase/acylaminoacyl peptidase
MSEGRISAPARDALTPRQREVMELIAAGKTNFEIAQHLGVSLEGAKYHVSEILAKLGVDSREEAVAAWQSGERRWRWPRMRFLVPAAAGIAALALTAVLLLALLQDDDPTPTEEPEAWLAWVADDLDDVSARTELHVRRGSQPDMELFPETDYLGWLSPRWSPDGRYLAVLGVREETGFGLILFDRDTRNVSNTTVERPVGPVAWTPESNALSFLGESGVVTYDLEFRQISRSESPPAPRAVPITSWSAWSPDGEHLALLGYGNILVMDEEGRFTVVDAAAAAVQDDRPFPILPIDQNQPHPPIHWQDNDAFRVYGFPPDQTSFSGSDSIQWLVKRDRSSWELSGPEPNPLPDGFVLPGESERRGRLLAVLPGDVQALTTLRFEEGRYDPGEPAHWAILQVVSEDRLLAEFELPNVILGPGSRARDFDLVLVSD